jgi:hypothetical protein
VLTKEVERALSSHSTKLWDLFLVLAFVTAVSVSIETVPEADPLGRRPVEQVCLGFVFCKGGSSVSPESCGKNNDKMMSLSDAGTTRVVEGNH